MNVKKKLINFLGVLLLPVAVFLVFFFLADGFGFHTIPIVISQSMISTTIGMAMAGILLTGMMDFSVGVRVLLGALLGGIFSNRFGVPGMIVGCLAGSLVGGYIIAFLYRLLRIPSMVISLGVVLILEAAAEKLTTLLNGSTRVTVPGYISAIGSFPNSIIFTVIAGVLLYYVLYKTKMGCYMTAVGNDEILLKSVGVSPDKVKFNTFVISGVFCFFVSIQQLCYAGTVQPITGMQTVFMVFKPMIGVMVGMQLLKLVDNLPLMIFIGEAVIALVFNGFIALGLTENIQNIVLGIFLILVMGISENAKMVSKFGTGRLGPRKCGEGGR